MIDKEELLNNKDFYKSFKNGEDLTSVVVSEVVSWQNRPLEDLHLIVWMDGIVFKVRENSKVINKTVYLAVGLNRDGEKRC